MNLRVTIKDTPTGRHLVLVDEAGEILPCQSKCTLVDEGGGIPRLVVEFVVDGDGLRLLSEDAAPPAPPADWDNRKSA